jgi:hypothetical protein
MSDLYGAFANAALDNYIQKADPRKFFSNNPTSSSRQSTDIESNNSAGSSGFSSN